MQSKLLIRNCLNGSDEADCDPTPLIKCPSNHHVCVSLSTYQLICLSIERANDDIVDCVGGIDEPTLCPQYVCDGIVHCENGDDEQFCNSIADEFFRNDQRNLKAKKTSNASLSDIVKSKSIDVQLKILNKYEYRCHRGLPLQVLLDSHTNLPTNACLCPPTYYGNRCQCQNERVSLTMENSAPSACRRTLFVLVMSLIDDSVERIIHSYEQLSYLPMRDQY
ncbi:unnamed protein product [Rotaria magnacalcarata]